MKEFKNKLKIHNFSMTVIIKIFMILRKKNNYYHYKLEHQVMELEPTENAGLEIDESSVIGNLMLIYGFLE